MHRIRIAAVLLWVPLASSCATFAELPNATLVWNSHSSPRPSAYLEVSIDGPPRWGLESLVERSLSDSGLFSSVSRERDEQDLRVSVSIAATQTPMSGALLSVLTGFLLPATDERSLSVAVTVHDPKRKIDSSAQHRHEYRTWMQLFLLPLWFTHSPASYERELIERLSRAGANEAWAASLAKESP